jgi:proton-translocating NADH-quinone oxidoreductase chain L
MSLAFIILFIPIFTLLLVCSRMRTIGTTNIATILISFSGLTFLLCMLNIILGLKYNFISYITIGNWFNSDLLLINWGFLFDNLTNTMLVIITSISFFVHFYANAYLNTDPHKGRFLWFLSLFTFFMILLVTSVNLLQFFLSWEGVGICSYLLINFWYGRIQANKAAIKALFMNRVGDIFLLIALGLIFVMFQTLDFLLIVSLFQFKIYATISYLSFKTNYLVVVGILILLGAVGKSAQLGLHTWLPDAMEGPTPVSALLHAATMVTAGIFLLLKCSFIFEYVESIKPIIVFWGLFTAFFSASIACTQTDIKKIIAYSTCSQLGYMTFTIGLSQYQLSLFHLFNHAFFKALLFISAGALIHSFIDEQDIRKLGTTVFLLPSLYIVNIIGTIAIIGYPFFSGFYSKDVILETTYNTFYIDGCSIQWLALLTTFLTSFYSLKILFIIFIDLNLVSKYHFENLKFPNILLFFSILVLSIFTCFVGFIFRDLFIGSGANIFNFIILPENYFLVVNEFLIFYIKLLPLFASLCGFIFLLVIYKNLYVYKIFILVIKQHFNFLNRKLQIDDLYNYYGFKVFKFFYNVPYKLIDKQMLEGLVIITSVKLLIKNAQMIISYHSGYLFHYLCLCALSLIFFITILVL